MVLFGPFCLLRSNLVIFGPFYPLWSYSVHFDTIWFTLILFCPIRSMLSTLVHFSPIRDIRYDLVLIGPFFPLWFYSVHLVHFGLIQSTLVLFGPVQSILSTLVLICPLVHIQSTRSTLFLFSSFGPLCSYSDHSVHFAPLQFIFEHLHDGKKYVWVKSTYSKSKFIKKCV